MTKFILEATDRRTGKTVYAHKRRGLVCFAREGGFMVNRLQGQDNPFAYYQRSEAEEFSGPEAIELMIQLAEDDCVAHRWAINPRVLLAQDDSVAEAPERAEP